MNTSALIILTIMLVPQEEPEILPGPYREVDQVLWVVSNLDSTIAAYSRLGFDQVRFLGKAEVMNWQRKNMASVRLARANLGGAIVNWIEPLEGTYFFDEYRKEHGEGAMALVHRFPDQSSLTEELCRLRRNGIAMKDEIQLVTKEGDLNFTLMDTETGGKYILGFTFGEDPMNIREVLGDANRHNLKLNQYAFAIRNPEPVSAFWQKAGFPAFQINHPELGETRYYGELVDHQLIQGWQRHGTVAYEWCIPVKPPIVYADHIQKHGEGIHHLAFSVEDMDTVLADYRSRGFVVSMGGTWGEKGKPGSGRYEYIDLDEAGGVTMELLWNYKE